MTRTPSVKKGARPNGEVRLAVNLPAQVHRQLKARAAAEGQTIRNYVLRLLRQNGIG